MGSGRCLSDIPEIKDSMLGLSANSETGKERLSGASLGAQTGLFCL